jgi:chromosome segregation ATPase
MANPASPLQQIVITSMETYMQTGTLIQSLRQTAQNQDRRLKELLNQLSVCQDQLRDAQERLDNLRDTRRREKRPEVVAGLSASSKSAGYFSSKE